MRSLRLIDRLAAVELSAERPALDLSQLPGLWVNANPETTGVALVEVAVEGAEAAIRVYGLGGAGLLDWGWCRSVDPLTFGPASPRGGGFLARYDLGFATVDLQANLNKGLMVLALCTRFADGSGRPDYFTREYFAVTHDRHLPPRPGGPRAVPLAAAPAAPDGSGLGYARTADLAIAGIPAAARLDPSPALGRWVNTNPATRGIAEIHLGRRDGGVELRVLGADEGAPIDWGATAAEVLANVEEEDGVPTVALAARYDLGDQRVDFQVRPNKGVLVPATFDLFAPGDPRFGYFGREFFRLAG